MIPIPRAKKSIPVVLEGHEYLRNASDTIHKHRNSLASQLRIFDSRWAHLFSVAPVLNKLTKGRQKPVEFHGNAQVLYQDVQVALEEAHRKQMARIRVPKEEDLDSLVPGPPPSIPQTYSPSRGRRMVEPIQEVEEPENDPTRRPSKLKRKKTVKKKGSRRSMSINPFRRSRSPARPRNSSRSHGHRSRQDPGRNTNKHSDEDRDRNRARDRYRDRDRDRDRDTERYRDRHKSSDPGARSPRDGGGRRRRGEPSPSRRNRHRERSPRRHHDYERPKEHAPPVPSIPRLPPHPPFPESDAASFRYPHSITPNSPPYFHDHYVSPHYQDNPQYPRSTDSSYTYYTRSKHRYRESQSAVRDRASHRREPSPVIPPLHFMGYRTPEAPVIPVLRSPLIMRSRFRENFSVQQSDR